jgi:hypothetical protein
VHSRHCDEAFFLYFRSYPARDLCQARPWPLPRTTDKRLLVELRPPADSSLQFLPSSYNSAPRANSVLRSTSPTLVHLRPLLQPADLLGPLSYDLLLAPGVAYPFPYAAHPPPCAVSPHASCVAPSFRLAPLQSPASPASTSRFSISGCFFVDTVPLHPRRCVSSKAKLSPFHF